MELLTKKAVKVGNSAGVLLPASWLNGLVEVKLIRAPPNQDKLINQLFTILKDEFLNIKSLAITGSYARGEEEIDSDIDVLIITEKDEKHLKIGNFDILFLTEEKIKENLEKNSLPLLPMLKEAKPIINGNLISKYAEYPLTKTNLKWHLNTTKSAIKLAKEDLKISKELNAGAGGAVAYSLVLRLRTLYLIDCLIKDKKWSNKEFKIIIKRISGSLNAYEDYLIVKNKQKKKFKLKIIEAEKLIKYLGEELEKIEKLLNKKHNKK